MNDISIAIKNYILSLQDLHELGILTNKRDFTSQLGEWLIECIYDGQRAENSIQKGWDVNINGWHIQVKSHSKAQGNDNRWSSVDKNTTDKIDELIIIEFSPFYKIINFYKLPWKVALSKIKSRNIKSPRFELNWSDIEEFKVDLDKLPKQEIISIFL